MANSLSEPPAQSVAPWDMPENQSKGTLPLTVTGAIKEKDNPLTPDAKHQHIVWPYMNTDPLANNYPEKYPIDGSRLSVAERQIIEVPMTQEEYEYLQAAKSRSPIFKSQRGRWLWVVPEMKLLVAPGDVISKANGLPIETFFDAVDNDLAIAREYANEDKIELEKGKEARRKANLLYRQRREEASEEVEEARLAWRKAVAEKKEAMNKWDNYVAYMRDRFRKSKSVAANRKVPEKIDPPEDALPEE